jgi:hypothetical protein
MTGVVQLAIYYVEAAVAVLVKAYLKPDIYDWGFIALAAPLYIEDAVRGRAADRGVNTAARTVGKEVVPVAIYNIVVLAVGQAGIEWEAIITGEL